MREVSSAVPDDTDRDLVIEVRDAWKDPALTAELSEALDARPDAVVVDVGWPAPPTVSVRGYVATHGTGALAATLVAAVLAGRDPVDAARSLIRRTQQETP